MALLNALRYFPQKHHEVLAPEFVKELEDYGHIYMYRFLPDVELKAFPLDEICAKTRHGAAIIHMICNNLDKRVAQFPQELVTYGGNGQVLSNWAQVCDIFLNFVGIRKHCLLPPKFWILLHYLSEMDESQTLAMYSGHPMGLFPSSPQDPRMIITNGMVIPNYSSKQDYDNMFALGVTM